MKTNYISRFVPVTILLFLALNPVAAQFFQTGGYQGGTLGSGGDDLLVGIPSTGIQQVEDNLTIYPNPFSDRTTIIYTPSRPGRIELEVFDMNNRRIRTFEPLDLSVPGNLRIIWEKDDNNGYKLSTGVYYLRITDSGHVLTRKVVVL